MTYQQFLEETKLPDNYETFVIFFCYCYALSKKEAHNV